MLHTLLWAIAAPLHQAWLQQGVHLGKSDLGALGRGLGVTEVRLVIAELADTVPAKVGVQG